MRRIIATGLKKPPAPHSWALASNSILCSVQVPIRIDGLTWSIENGDAARQTEVTLVDLKATLKAADATPNDVTLVQIYLSSLEHKPAVDEIYMRFFEEPYPVRACVTVSEPPTQGTIIEIVATATLSH